MADPEKITQLDEVTSLVDGDLIPVVVDTGGTPTTKHIKNENLPVPASSPLIIVDFYEAGTTLVPFTPGITIDLDTVRQSNAAFSLAAGVATCNTDGKYLLHYDVTMDAQDATDRVFEFWLEKNGTEVPGTRARIFNDAIDENGSCHGMAVLDLVATDTVNIEGEKIASGTGDITRAQGSRLIIQGGF